MAYRGGNFSFVVEPSFQPFTMQEMLVPFTAYKEAYEKAEEGYLDLSSKADKFKYLSETLPEDSKARQLYEGYAGFLATQAEDLARNGYSIANRGALTSLKRRYQGEIGRLVEADTALKKEQELRRTMNAKDSSMLYAADNLTIDNFLDGSTPNLYSISGNDLYVKGAAAGKAASSRIFKVGDAGSTLGGYYRDWVTRNGYSPESLRDFRRSLSAIPELQQAVDDILLERGVNENLTGNELARARQSVINGIIDGAVYQEVHNPQRDLGVMTASEKAADQRAKDSLNLQRENMEINRTLSGIVKRNGEWVYDLNQDMAVQKAAKIAEIKAANGGKSGSSTQHNTMLNEGVKIHFNGDTPNDEGNGEADDDYEVSKVGDAEKHSGNLVSYDRLPSYVKKIIGPYVKGNTKDLYDFYYRPYSKGTFLDTQAEVEIIPRKVIVQDRDTDGISVSVGNNDIPE